MSNKVDKYNLRWQLTRVRCRALTTVGVKLRCAVRYVDETRSQEALERVLNWMDGLAMAYVARDQARRGEIMEAKASLEARRGEFTQADEDDDIGKVESSEIKSLYKDLRLRSMKWLSVGQIHQGQEAFLDMLWDELCARGYGTLLLSKHEALKQARVEAAAIKARGEARSTFFF